MFKRNRVCDDRGYIKGIFLCEFHPTAGPQIICQVPDDYISKNEFESINVYIIPKAPLFQNVITITIFGLKILGFPARIDDKKYARNAYYFNLCFVFDSWVQSTPYEPVVKKLTEYLLLMETENRFLSTLNDCRKYNSLTDMLSQVMNDLNTQNNCILAALKVTTYLKVMQILNDPSSVQDDEVPVLVESSTSQINNCDLTTNQILPFINGINHVTKISLYANVNKDLVKSCLENLIYYGVVRMIPIFQYSNSYTVMPKICRLASNKKLQTECISAVARKGKQMPQIRDIINFYANMKSEFTMKDLCLRFNPVELHIDERKLIQFGILEKLIRQIYVVS